MCTYRLWSLSLAVLGCLKEWTVQILSVWEGECVTCETRGESGLGVYTWWLEHAVEEDVSTVSSLSLLAHRQTLHCTHTHTTHHTQRQRENIYNMIRCSHILFGLTLYHKPTHRAQHKPYVHTYTLYNPHRRKLYASSTGHTSLTEGNNSIELCLVFESLQVNVATVDCLGPKVVEDGNKHIRISINEDLAEVSMWRVVYVWVCFGARVVSWVCFRALSGCSKYEWYNDNGGSRP